MSEKATFAAGCFWGIEHTFGKIDGVISTAVGYIGGKTTNPTYHEVCEGTTGHAEAVELEFDPTKVKYEELLNVFWENHNPTTLNRQGPDVGSQYRSSIFFHSEDQKIVAEKSKGEVEKSGKWSSPVVTEIVSAPAFFLAEDYHQKYVAKKSGEI